MRSSFRQLLAEGIQIGTLRCADIELGKLILINNLAKPLGNVARNRAEASLQKRDNAAVKSLGDSLGDEALKIR